MDENTPRLALPMLSVGQAQKELAHNEALVRLDLAVQAAVVSVGRNEPPEGPDEGDSWTVGAMPTGAWAGQAHALAGWTAGGWRFVAPRSGMRVWDIATGQEARYEVPGGWASGRLVGAHVAIDGIQVLGPQQPAIMAPADGTVIDTQTRAAVGAVIEALRAHGLIAT